LKALIDSDFTEATEPFALFESWFEEAQKTEPNDPDAMALATTDTEGLPDVRMVLLKSATPQGFVFFSNAESAKGRELAANMKAAAVLHWKSLRRQIRFRGPVEPASQAEADAYFESRPRQSRIGAWASQQSRPLESRTVLEAEVAKLEAAYGDGTIPRPPYWGGYRIKPLAIEFWEDGPFRLHNRIVFRRRELDAPWSKERLYP
jgi:pyridoxamine 5'-phosphate oxidase